MLTSEQEAIIESTAPVVAEHLELITQRFYIRDGLMRCCWRTICPKNQYAAILWDRKAS